MFSVDNFYEYLTYNYSRLIKKSGNNFVYGFSYNGSKDLYTLCPLGDGEIFQKECMYPLNLARFYAGIFLFDQEPLDLSAYYMGYNPAAVRKINYDTYTTYLNQTEQFIMRLSSVHTPIVCHSERNSADVNELEHYGLLPVYYWYHGLIARDWFRHWKHYTKKNNHDAKRFGLYARDSDGTRTYRLKLISDLSLLNNDVHFFLQPTIKDQIQDQHIKDCWEDAPVEYSSNASAIITWEDQQNFQIQIVAETLFEEQKIFLTEKVFKPIVMEQPFILFAPPLSLQYMRDYGFETFSDIWDESYDQIVDHNERYHAIIKLINNINSLNKEDFDNLLTKADAIVHHNKKHFYSEKFEEILLNELHRNFNDAFCKQNENFFSNPGGTWFEMVQKLYERSGTIGHDPIRLRDMNRHIEINWPDLAKEIQFRYKDVFRVGL